MEIILVRHGENLANITKEFSHKKVDYELTEKGILQSRQTSEALRNLKIDRIISSPLKRAIQTAEQISNSIGLTVEIDECFREINVGILEDEKPTKENWDIYSKIVSDWYTGNLETRFPGGESGKELRARFKKGIEKLVNEKTTRVVIVGHAGIFINGIMGFCGLNKPIEFYSENYHNCSISTVKVQKQKTKFEFLLKTWGQINHLSGKAAEFESWK